MADLARFVAASATCCTPPASPDPSAPAGSPRSDRVASPRPATIDELYWLGRVTLDAIARHEIDAFDAVSPRSSAASSTSPTPRATPTRPTPVARPGRSQPDRQAPAPESSGGRRDPAAVPATARTTTTGRADSERGTTAPVAAVSSAASGCAGATSPTARRTSSRAAHGSSAQLAVVAPAGRRGGGGPEPRRRRDRPAGHAAHGRAGPAATRSRCVRRSPTDAPRRRRAHRRRVGVDGALLARATSTSCTGRPGAACRGVRVRHPAHPAHASAAHQRPRPRLPQAAAATPRLVGRHPHRGAL